MSTQLDPWGSRDSHPPGDQSFREVTTKKKFTAACRRIGNLMKAVRRYLTRRTSAKREPFFLGFPLKENPLPVGPHTYEGSVP